MVQLRFDLSGFDTYQTALARMIALLTDLRPFWPRLVPLWVLWMRKRFDTEGEFGGEEWAPLSEDYLARKMTLYPGKGILYATGQLRRHTSRPVRVVTPTSITFLIEDFQRNDGTTMEIDWFQSGTATAPPRPLIPESWHAKLPLEMQEQVEELAQDYVDEMAARLGLK
jgi:hypothetical protein